MARLIVHVEGVTEENFVNDILRPHLVGRGYHDVSARRMGNARQRTHRHGIRPWPSAKDDILRRLRSDSTCVVSTFVDFYALPAEGIKGWPGRAHAGSLPFDRRGEAVERAILEDLASAIGDIRRVVPFVMVHEFEALLFSDCAALSHSLQRTDLEPALQGIRDRFQNPEEINDSPDTKRLATLMPGYQKALAGPHAARAIGLDRMRAECPHFADWLSRLEALTAV